MKLNYLNKIKSNANANVSRTLLGRFVALALFTAVMAGTWDAWWHGAVGRDTLFEPPHILLYSAVILAIILGIYGYIKYKDKLWTRLSILLVLVPISAPFDEIWHRIFGVEDISTIWAVWSPPHIVLVGAIIGSLIMLLPILRKDHDMIARQMFGSMTIAAILTLMIFLVAPFEPTGPWGILGFYGAGAGILVIVGGMLFAQQYNKAIGSSTLMIAFFILISSVGVGGEIADGVIISPHDHAPSWLNVFSLLITAVLIDISRKSSPVIRGALGGLVLGGLIYGLSSMYFEPQFQYSLFEGSIAVLSSLIGGVIGGVININKSLDNL